jgi:hypothetical protein
VLLPVGVLVVASVVAPTVEGVAVLLTGTRPTHLTFRTRAGVPWIKKGCLKMSEFPVSFS